jgi:microcystin-dependent protein
MRSIPAMADPFVAEIRPFAFNFAPVGWAICNGQILSIAQNTALFSLIGTFYGGNGTSNFALPNLQGIVPMGQGSGPGLTPRVVGETGGEEQVTLTSAQMPNHNHAMAAIADSATARSPAAGLAPAEGHGGGRGGAFNLNAFTSNGPNTQLAPGSVSADGGGGPHNNTQPSLVINWCIALQGIYPPRS